MCEWVRVLVGMSVVSSWAALGLCSIICSVRLTLPPSITKPISSIVIEVSAILVEMITLRTPTGGCANTFDCCSVDSDECSAITMNLSEGQSRPVRASNSVIISMRPGKNTKIAPETPCSE